MIRTLFNPLDPLAGIKDDLLDLYTKMTDLLQQIVINPPRGSANLDDVFTAAGNYGVWLAYTVVLWSVTISALLFRKFDRIGKSFIVLVVLTMLFPLLQELVAEMVLFSDDLSAALRFYTPPENAPQPPGLSSLGNVVGIIWGLSIVLPVGSALIGLIGSYQMLIYAFMFMAPITYGISAFGRRSKAISNAILSIGLVSTTFGRPLAVFFLELGELANYTIPFGRTFLGTFLLTLGSYIFAILSQVVLFFVAYSSTKWVQGKVGAVVKGQVSSKITGTAKVDVQRTNTNHAKAFRKVRHEFATVATKEVASKVVKSGSKVAASGVAMAAAKVASNVHPYAKVAVVAATVATKFGGKFKQPAKGG